MVPTTLKRFVVCVVFTVWMLVSGCLGRSSEHDARTIAELHRQLEQSANAEKRVLQLQKDLDAAKNEVQKCTQAKNEMEATITTMQQESGGVKEKKLAQAEEKVSQLQKDLDAARIEIEKAKSEAEKARSEVEKAKTETDAAKHETEKVEQAKKEIEARVKMLEQENAALTSRGRKVFGVVENLSGAWEITYQNDVHAATLEALGSNNYRLGPRNLAFSGIYRFDGATLSMIAENPGHSDLVWSMKKPGVFEMLAGNYAGASMKRKVAGGQPQ